MQYTISDVRPHPALPGCLSVTLNRPDPTGQYSTWKVSFDPKNGAVPPVAGTVIETELDMKVSQTGSEYYWIRNYTQTTAGQPVQTHGAQQVAQALPANAIPAAPPAPANVIPAAPPAPVPARPVQTRYRDATNPEDQRNIQECTKLDREYQAVATIVSAIISDWKDVTQNDAAALTNIVHNVAHAVRSGMATSQNSPGW
jgi:hypothetical protein